MNRLNPILIFTVTLGLLGYFSLLDEYYERTNLENNLKKAREALYRVKTSSLNSVPYQRQLDTLRESRDVYLSFLGLRSYQENRTILQDAAHKAILAHQQNYKVFDLTYRTFTLEQTGSVEESKALLSKLLVERTKPWLVIQPIKLTLERNNSLFSLNFRFSTIGYNNEE